MMQEVDPNSPESIHWRPRHSGQRRFDYESLIGLLALAVAGTALAGVVFPTVLVLVEVCFGDGGPQGLDTGGYLFGVAFLGGMVGGMLAFIVSVPVALFAALIGRLIGVTGRDVWYASLVGSWTGFFAIHLLLGGTGMGTPGPDSFVALAVATGQVVTGAFVWYVQKKAGAYADLGDELRFGIRQLFGVTTAVAIIASVAHLIRRKDDQIFSAALMAIGIQVAIIGIAFAASLYTRSRRSARTVSREASTRSA